MIAPPTQPDALHPAGRPSLRSSVVLALFLVIAGVAALAVDLTVSRAFMAQQLGEQPSFKLPGDLRKGVNICEAFGHGVGVGLILLTLYVVDRRGRRRLPRMLACVLAAGIAANLAKLLIARTRPHAFFHRGMDFDSVSVGDTFEGLLRFGAGGSASQSFPSAHSAVAAGLAVALIWRFPQGRWLFPVFAVLAGCQRVVSGAHYVSDVCWGLAIGLVAAAIFTGTNLGDRVFRRVEGNPPG